MAHCIQIVGIDTASLFALRIFTRVNIRCFFDNIYTFLFMKDNNICTICLTIDNFDVCLEVKTVGQ